MAYTEKMRRMFGESKTRGKKHQTIKFRRAHYAFVADAMKNARCGAFDEDEWFDFCTKISRRFKTIDNGFDVSRFMLACGVA